MSKQGTTPEEPSEDLDPPETRIEEDVDAPVRPWVAPADPAQDPS